MWLDLHLLGHQLTDGDDPYALCQTCKGSGIAMTGKTAPSIQYFDLILDPGDSWTLTLNGGLYVAAVQMSGMK